MRNHARAKRAAMINRHMRIQMRCLADRCPIPDKHMRIKTTAFASMTVYGPMDALGASRAEGSMNALGCTPAGGGLSTLSAKYCAMRAKVAQRLGTIKKAQNDFELILAK